MSIKRHVLQVVALVTAVALVFGAFAGSAGAKKLTKKQKTKIRAELRKMVKKNPAAVKRRSFLRRAGLVDFKLPVTIRLRNVCDATQNTAGGMMSPGGALLTTENCATQGTALNQRTIPSARVNLGPSLGIRDVAIGGALAAVVEFNDTYDGGALGNVNLKILPGNKTLTTSSVPLLWNNDITRTGTRSDANFAKANFRVGSPLYYTIADKYDGVQDNVWTAGGLAAAGFIDSIFAAPAQQGCGSATSDTIGSGTFNGIPYGGSNPETYAAQVLGAPVGYKALFYGVPIPLASWLATAAGLPGYTVYTIGGSPNGVYLPIHAGIDNPLNIRAGGVIGDNDWIGPNPHPFPSGFAPGTGTGTVGGTVATYGGAADTVLRTSALSLGIAPGGVSVNMSSGTATTLGGLTTAQGSQDVTLGYSGGQANLFGTIPGKNVGIDVTVNLATKINSIARIMDQDVFKTPSLIEGENYPAGIFNCRQIVTGAVQNYIPGVRLTGSLRIAPAITKDGKVRIAKATVSSHSNDPDRVALSACLFPAKSYNADLAGSTDTTAKNLPTVGAIPAGGAFYSDGQPSHGLLPSATNTALPGNSDARRYPNLSEGNAPVSVPCNADTVPELADIIRDSGLTGTVSGLPTPTDPAYNGVSWNGSQATVAGDITVNPIEVDVLLGDQVVGT